MAWNDPGNLEHAKQLLGHSTKACLSYADSEHQNTYIYCVVKLEAAVQHPRCACDIPYLFFTRNATD